MGMKKGFSGVIPYQREREADEFSAVKSAQNLSASMLRDDENCSWNRNLLAPDGALDLNAFFKFGERLAMPDLDVRRGRTCVGSVNFHFATAGLGASRRLERFHSSSMRPRGRSANCFPSARAAASI